MTPERKHEIIAQAKAEATHGPWSDQLRKQLTNDEIIRVTEFWYTMPLSASWVDAFCAVPESWMQDKE